jgi:Zn-dependent protease with chaperone function
MEIIGRLFDGKSSQEHAIRVRIEGAQSLVVSNQADESRQIVRAEFKVLPPVGRGPIRIRLNDGGLIELFNGEDQCQEILKNLGEDTHIGEWLARSYVRVFQAFSVALVVCVGVYFFVIPQIATTLSPWVPARVKETVGTQAVSFLDGYIFKDSQLTLEQQQAARALADEITTPNASNLEISLIFRRMEDKESYANAVAILPRHMVFTDGIVRLLEPDELQAVVAHELGHLVHDHGTVALIRASSFSLAALMLFGGGGSFESLAIGMLSLKYSKDDERQADRFGVELLEQRGKDGNALARALTKLSRGGEENFYSTYLSTHPLTSERIQIIHQIAGP